MRVKKRILYHNPNHVCTQYNAGQADRMQMAKVETMLKRKVKKTLTTKNSLPQLTIEWLKSHQGVAPQRFFVFHSSRH